MVHYLNQKLYIELIENELRILYFIVKVYELDVIYSLEYNMAQKQFEYVHFSLISFFSKLIIIIINRQCHPHTIKMCITGENQWIVISTSYFLFVLKLLNCLRVESSLRKYVLYSRGFSS